jgi:hypothetical protein
LNLRLSLTWLVSSGFEDLEVWKSARSLSGDLQGHVGVGFLADTGLGADQRASVSVMSNIAEGFERGGDKEFFSSSPSEGSCGRSESSLRCRRPGLSEQ